MIKLGSAALIASLWLVGCAADGYRYSDSRDYRNSCSAPAVGLCAGCEIACSRHDEAYCEPGRTVPPEGTVAGYCSEQSRCVCRD